MKRTQRLLPIRAFCKIGRISLIYQTINMFLNLIGDATTRTRKGTVYLFMEAGTHGKHSIDPIRSHVLKSFPFADQRTQIVGQVWGLLKFPRSFSTRTGWWKRKRRFHQKVVILPFRRYRRNLYIRWCSFAFQRYSDFQWAFKPRFPGMSYFRVCFCIFYELRDMRCGPTGDNVALPVLTPLIKQK